MSRFNCLLVASFLIASPVQIASAQQATLTVSARVLPAPDALASGLVAPRSETGHTMVASARLDASVTAPMVSAKVVSAGDKDFVEFNLGVAVASNVQYSVGVSAGKGSTVQARSADGRFQSVGTTPVALRSATTASQGRQNVTYRVPLISSGQQAPASLTITLTASSIS